MPVANAGPDFEVDEQSNVMLDGSSSTDEDGSIATYSWNQVGGPPLELNDDQSVAPSFTAPNVDSNQQFTFQVSVTDNEGSSDTDTVNILVKDLASEEIKQPSDSDS
jgi:PKD domain